MRAPVGAGAAAERETPIDAQLLLPVSPALIWEVLTDYERLADFVPDLIESRVVSAPGEPRLLAQRGRTRIGVFSAEVAVTLRVDEYPIERLQFTAVKGNVREMRGEWRIVALGKGAKVVYSVELVPAFWMPASVGPALVRRHVDTQLQGIEGEIMRRAEARGGFS
ncbi:MAG TPA: SRPBCC family protein [Pelomicrobium sp.]|nr:SRPBCC family protein [Pelomicrobium sp.]